MDVSKLTLQDIVSKIKKFELFVIETCSALPFPTSHDYTCNEPLSTNQVSRAHLLDNERKPRAYTECENHVYIEPTRMIKPPKLADVVETSNFNDASSCSDSEDNERGLVGDKEYKTVKSDDIPTSTTHVGLIESLIGIHKKPFTGKLNIKISKMSGILSPDMSSYYYCTIEINKEFKAKTRTQAMDQLEQIDEEFDIDVQMANMLTLKLFRQERILNDKCLAVSNILLGRLFQHINQKKIELKSVKGEILTKLSVKFTEARRHLQRQQSNRASGVFGFDLSHTLSAENKTIPIIVRKCVAEIKNRGFLFEGIYRISGNFRNKKDPALGFQR